jgi:hypothetical protein
MALPTVVELASDWAEAIPQDEADRIRIRTGLLMFFVFKIQKRTGWSRPFFTTVICHY